MVKYICAIAKMENNYINDWCKWHLSLGFDKIVIYDNNDEDYEPVESRIDSGLLNKIEIIKVPEVFDNFQRAIYQQFYEKYNNQFDWCAFIDIDEFIVIKKWKSLDSFLSSEFFNDVNIIQLDWHLYGDNDEITQDTAIPIYNRITKEIRGEKVWRNNHYGKSIVRGHLDNIKFISAHCPKFGNQIPERGLADGTKIKNEPLHRVGKRLEEAYIAHYMTKTLDEFLSQKFQRIEHLGAPKTLLTEDESQRLKYFFGINKKTSEKIKYIEKRLGHKVNI